MTKPECPCLRHLLQLRSGWQLSLVTSLTSLAIALLLPPLPFEDTLLCSQGKSSQPLTTSSHFQFHILATTMRGCMKQMRNAGVWSNWILYFILPNKYNVFYIVKRTKVPPDAKILSSPLSTNGRKTRRPSCWPPGPACRTKLSRTHTLTFGRRVRVLPGPPPFVFSLHLLHGKHLLHIN